MHAALAAAGAPAPRTWVAAIGKAAATMALGAHDALGEAAERFLIISHEVRGLETLGTRAEVHLSAHQVVLADCSYWRSALAGLAMGVLDMFCQKSYMHERAVKKREAATAFYRVQWA